MTHTILIVLFFVLEILATFQDRIPVKVNLCAAGLACLAASLLF